jgi:hypothetical protein
MPQNTSQAVRPNGSGTQAIVRSEQRGVLTTKKENGSSTVGDSVNCCDMPRTATKRHLSRLPRPKVVRIQQRYIGGENQTQIARAEGCDRETVSRIVRSSEMAEYIEHMKEEFRGLVPDALAALRHTLQTQKDGRIALEILRDVGVAPRRGAPLTSPATTPEDGYSRQAIMVANVMLEARDRMCVELPPEAEEALAKDTQKRADAAKTSRANPSHG